MWGWGTVFGFFAQALPGRKEKLRRKIRQIEEEMDEIVKKPPFDKSRYDTLSRKLSEIKKRVEEI